MKAAQPSPSLWARLTARIKAWYQSARESVRWSPLRYYLGTSGRPRDPNQANDERSRQQSIELSQEAELNDPIAIRLGNIYTQYTVGSGLRVKAASSDQEWNAINQAKWDLWSKICDLTSVQDFDSFMVMVARRDFYDGGGYILKTRGDEAPYYPRLQFIEAMNVQTPPQFSDRKNIFDGKETDPRGRIIAYHVRQVVNGEESYRRIPSVAIIPICDFDRPGELHTFPYLDPVLNLLRDRRELRKLALDKAKEAAETKNVFKTQNKEIPDAEAMRQVKLTGARDLKDGTAVTKQTLQMMDEKLGGKNIAIGIDEDVSQLAAATPNEIEQAHYRIILSEICAGVNIPMMLVSPESLQGTVSRAVLDDFALFVRQKFQLYRRVAEEVYRYVTAEHIKIDRQLSDFDAADFDWWRCSVRPPRAPNVDRGRDASALLGALEVGGATLDDFYGPQGLDTEEQIDRGCFLLSVIKEKAAKYKVEPEAFSRAIREATKANIDAEQKVQAEADAEDAAQLQKQAA